MDKEKKIKAKIAEIAAQRYVRNERFTYKSAARQMGIETSEVRKHFGTRASMLSYFYDSRIYLYQEHAEQLDAYNDFTLSEKLSDFLLFLFDEFGQHQQFVLKTYKRFVIKNEKATNFEVLFKDQVKKIFESDGQISAPSSLILSTAFYSSVYYKFHAFYHFWSSDESEHQQQTMALIDKWSSFVEEIFYTKIVEKGADLGKFLLYNSPLKKILHK